MSKDRKEGIELRAGLKEGAVTGAGSIENGAGIRPDRDALHAPDMP